MSDRIRSGVATAALMLAALQAGAAQAQAQSGKYGPDAFVLIGTNEAMVSYFYQGEKRGMCACELRGALQPDGSYAFDNRDDSLEGAEKRFYDALSSKVGRFFVDATGLHFAVRGHWACCSVGDGPVKRARPFAGPPAQCTVIVERSPFYQSPPATPLPRHPYMQRGDKVQAIPARAPDEGAFTIAMFQGTKKATIGYLKRADLDCTTP